jgi:ubiquinone/menaquinone biosynthesis C-methylase UbiE
MKRKPIRMKPPRRLARAGGFDRRKQMGRVWRGMLVRDAGLTRDGAVLDVGCGLGRMAVPLMKYLGDAGRYEGFDVDPEAIRWCRTHITAKRPNFCFTAVDLRSGLYNPDALVLPASFVFPYQDATFDVAFLASVFTHLLPDALERYLHELARVLKPGGRCLASYFLLNETSERAIATGKAKPLHRFPEQLPGCRVLNREVPETAVAYEEARIRELYSKCGLTIVEPIHYGRWAGRASRTGQDIILATRPGPR